MVKKIILLAVIGIIIVFLAGFLIEKPEVVKKPEIEKPEKDIVVTKKTATLPEVRNGLACAENSATHKIYCFGGENWKIGYFNEIVEYDPQTDTLTTKTATLPTKRYGLACAENSATHKIYCFGGYDKDIGYLDEIIEYDPETDTLTTKTTILPTGFSDLACVENSATHKIYCFGGFGSDRNQIVEYDPQTDTLITKKATLPTGRDDLACAENSATHKIYCFGGYVGGYVGEYPDDYLKEIVEYDPVTDTLTTKRTALPTGRAFLACAENSATHKIYCFGGYGYFRNSLDEIVEYDPAEDTLTTKTATLPTERWALVCVENSATHKIYCFGGGSDQIVEYDPARDM